MLVTCMGSQGAGKTTILSRLKESNYNIIERKTSRSILSDWNVTLQEVNNNPELTIKFQEEIIQRKFNDEAHARLSDEIWFTERSYIDLAVYTIVSLGKDNQYSEWLSKYVNKCIQYHQHYDLVFYLQAGHFTPEDDGVRGTNHLYSRMVDLLMHDLTQQSTLPDQFVCIKTPLLEQRIMLIKQLTGRKYYTLNTSK